MDQTQTETTETEETNPLFKEAAQAIIDKHMKDIVQELLDAGIHAHGVVVGVLHDADTSTNWCVSDDARGPDGQPITAATVVRDIAAGIVATVGAEEDIDAIEQ